MPDTLHVYTNEYETFVAANVEEAMAMAHELSGEPTDPEEWGQLPDESYVTIRYDEDDEGGARTERKTCAEWAAEKAPGRCAFRSRPMPTNDPPTCPICGQAAEVATSDEGTTFVRQLERAADLLRRDRAVADLARHRGEGK